jgi:ATP-binding cassette, subfamily B, bacterial
VDTNQKEKPSLKGFIKLFIPYRFPTIGLLVLTIAINGVNLYMPRLIAQTIDSFSRGTFNQGKMVLLFGSVILVTLVLSLIQTFVQTYLSESVGRDLRNKIADKISNFSYRQIITQTPSKLLTNFTSDVDGIKQFIAQALIMLVSSIILIIGSVILLLSINVKLSLIVFAILPLILVAFFVIFKNVGELFTKAQEVTDKLNKVISENVFGASLIRVLNSQYEEIIKFRGVNEEARTLGTMILKMFAALIPVITTVANLCVLAIVFFGGKAIIANEITIGQFVSFYNYISLLIFPLVVLGFISGELGRALASYQRIESIMEVPEDINEGTVKKELDGTIEFKDVSFSINNQSILKNISFQIKHGKKTALLGPTAAGKTQIFYLLANLTKPDTGEILYDGIRSADFDKDTFFKQIGLVFQDSVIFNTSVKENIAFRDEIAPEALEKAIKTAELEAFIDALPQGLETIISERGSSLSGGQKQRLTLARALAHSPSILLLDDFTARVDNETERRIFENIDKNYPEITKILITQKISSIKDADQIILLMEGELLATGTHDELMKSSFEYKQIAQSQRTTE